MALLIQLYNKALDFLNLIKEKAYLSIFDKFYYKHIQQGDKQRLNTCLTIKDLYDKLTKIIKMRKQMSSVKKTNTKCKM